MDQGVQQSLLGSDGLSYFWQQLKGTFATPQGAADAAAANTYYVAAQSVGTQAGSITLTLPIPAIQGMSVRFQSPCNSGDVEAGLVIDGMSYQWRSVANDDITSLPDLFAVDSVVDIALDRDNLIAYFIGASPVPPVISFPTANPPANRIPGREYFRVLADFEGGTP